MPRICASAGRAFVLHEAQQRSAAAIATVFGCSKTQHATVEIAVGIEVANGDLNLQLANACRIPVRPA